MKFAEVECEDLLNSEIVSGACLCQFKTNFVVGHWDDFVSGKSLLKFELLLALHVEAEEAGGEQNRVLEVALDLRLNRVTDQTLLSLVSDCDTAKLTWGVKTRILLEEKRDLRCLTVGAIVEHDFDSLALDDAHDCLLGSKINSYTLAG